MEHVIAGYLREIWEMSGWLYEGQHYFRPGHSRESQLGMVCQDIADSLDEGVRRDTIIIDFSKGFRCSSTWYAAYENRGNRSGFGGSCWVKKFLLGHLQRVRVDRQISEEVRVTSGVPQRSVLGPLLFLAYVNDIWRNNESNIQLFTDDCIIMCGCVYMGFVMCACFGNMCTCIYCVLYCLYCVMYCFVYIYLFLFVLSVLV